MHDFLPLRQLLFQDCQRSTSSIVIIKFLLVRDIKYSWILTLKCALMYQIFSNRSRIMDPHPVSNLPQFKSWLHNYFSKSHDLCPFNVDLFAGTPIKDLYFWSCRFLEYNHAGWAHRIKCYNSIISQEDNMYIWVNIIFGVCCSEFRPSELNMIGCVSIPKSLQSDVLNW